MKGCRIDPVMCRITTVHESDGTFRVSLHPFEKADGTFRSLLDRDNQVGKAYGCKYVPVGILLDASGKLARSVSSVNIDQEGFRGELEELQGVYLQCDFFGFRRIAIFSVNADY